MSFQAYLDNIQARTGKSAGEIAAKVRGRGLSKPGEIIAWLKDEYGLGRGHAMAIVSLVRSEGQLARSPDDRLGTYFTGARAKWRAAFDCLAEHARTFGPDVSVSAGATYLSLLKSGRKFAIVQALGARLDIGLKLKAEAAAQPLEHSAAWNAMVTHRVRISDESQLDTQVFGWLKQAYAEA
jgi:hypothetical protein